MAIQPTPLISHLHPPLLNEIIFESSPLGAVNAGHAKLCGRVLRHMPGGNNSN